MGEAYYLTCMNPAPIFAKCFTLMIMNSFSLKRQ